MKKPRRSTKTRAVFVAMTPDLVAALDAKARKEHRSRSQMAGLLLADALSPAEPSQTSTGAGAA